MSVCAVSQPWPAAKRRGEKAFLKGTPAEGREFPPSSEGFLAPRVALAAVGSICSSVCLLTLRHSILLIVILQA